jgi:hypothetical protein
VDEQLEGALGGLDWGLDCCSDCGSYWSSDWGSEEVFDEGRTAGIDYIGLRSEAQ